ncbi:GNAT family N-acetyltransferase [Streptacidiphilus sp. P02-A3a]|uniref:GNAT family N-acetyltransferase n=1 Tax=Streptacidiphilus sp. P02-A3a TaxID=2704468 RepID=UPI0015F78E7E|nr:GNAT family N-acetyltransferase [Streptacidiphilus sp. P02-A3a]QMU66973.1 GNAT family N-acetyltransferase [Streptacidiphilus sp. P02-A3a]
MSEELVRAWVNGWARSRGTASPVPVPWGLRVEVGLPDQVVRHVLPQADEARVRAMAAQVSAPHTWLRAFVPEATLAPWLSAAWTPTTPHHLMATDLRPAPTPEMDGYRLTMEVGGGVIRVRVLAADGSPAARGQAAPVGAHATFDQVVTEGAHQRRGLGSLVMRALANAAMEQGAEFGVLGATDEGRALYESLGWKVHAPLTGFVYVP